MKTNFGRYGCAPGCEGFELYRKMSGGFYSKRLDREMRALFMTGSALTIMRRSLLAKIDDPVCQRDSETLAIRLATA